MANRTGKYIQCKNTTCESVFYAQPHQIESGRKKFCSKSCLYTSGIQTMTFQKGHPDLVPPEKRGHTEETKKKISENNWMRKNKQESNPNWKGGRGTRRHAEMGQKEYKEWRKAVFERDGYACSDCKRSNTFIHADHIMSWSGHPELRYEVSNGKTLCYICHYVKTFGRQDMDAALRWGVPPKLRSFYNEKTP